jgi:hypothetical protein
VLAEAVIGVEVVVADAILGKEVVLADAGAAMS